MLVIQKGHIKKSHSMSSLEHYDAEDGLQIITKFKDGELAFEADNTEEKYRLCCLLGLAMQIGQGDEDSIDSGHGHGFLSDHHMDNCDVIKDGLLEKKGNTTITTWNKRRIRLTPGELSYYKPGEDLALNVIQLWKERSILKKHHHNGFTLTIRSRVYSFRTVHDYKATHMTEIARDDWYEAFEKAISLPPTTSKILDMNMFSDVISMRHHNDTRSSIDSNASSRSSSGSNCSSKIKRDEPFYDATPDVLERFIVASQQYTTPFPKSLRGNTLPIKKTTTTTNMSPKGDKHIMAFLKRSQSSEDLLDSSDVPRANLRRQSREFHGLSPMTVNDTITQPSLTSSASTSDLLDSKQDREDIFSGTAAAFRAKLAEKGGKSSSLKDYRAKKELKANDKFEGVKRGVCKAYNMFLVGADFRARSLDRAKPRQTPHQLHPIIDLPESKMMTQKIAPSPLITDIPHVRPDDSDKIFFQSDEDSVYSEASLSFPIPRSKPPSDDSENNPRALSTFSSSGLMPSTEAATLLIRDTPSQSPTNSNDIPNASTTNDTHKRPSLPEAPPSLSRQNKTKAKHVVKPVECPPAPPIHPTPLPCPPPPPPVPEASIITHDDVIGCSTPKQAQRHGLKLKQIHWTKVGHNQLTSSLWKDVHDVSDKLDLTELEEQFAVVSSKSQLAKSGNQQENQMLMDPKRAQNLGILFCGLKLDSIHRLLEALNSTTELECFTADRLATLKRCQPTTEELEMYRGCAKRTDNNSLHDVDKFMVELCDIPKLGLRVDLVLTLWEFPGRVFALEQELTDIMSASEQLLESVALAKVLEYILAIGNVMNSTWGCKQDSAGGFQLSSLDKILSVKGRDSKTTLCGYLVKQLKRNDSTLLTWPDSVEAVTKCADYSVKAVGAEIDVMKKDLQKIKRSSKVVGQLSSSEVNFLIDVQQFISEQDKKLDQIDVKYVKVSDKYKELLARFGETTSSSPDSIFSILCSFVDKFNQAKHEQDVM